MAYLAGFLPFLCFFARVICLFLFALPFLSCLASVLGGGEGSFFCFKNVRFLVEVLQPTSERVPSCPAPDFKRWSEAAHRPSHSALIPAHVKDAALSTRNHSDPDLAFFGFLVQNNSVCFFLACPYHLSFHPACS